MDGMFRVDPVKVLGGSGSQLDAEGKGIEIQQPSLKHDPVLAGLHPNVPAVMTLGFAQADFVTDFRQPQPDSRIIQLQQFGSQAGTRVIFHGAH